MVGYPTPSSFGRMFRCFYGISPNQWRKKMCSEIQRHGDQLFPTAPAASRFSHEYMEQLKHLIHSKRKKEVNYNDEPKRACHDGASVWSRTGLRCASGITSETSSLPEP